MSAVNIFRILGDLSHVSSKAILMWSIHWNHSAEGVSLITQVLYILVFVTRYLDLLHTPIFSEWLLWWNFCAKIFYLASSAYIVFLMTFVYARTREKEKAWKFGMYCLAGAVVLALPVSKLFEEGPVVFKYDDSRVRLLWSHPFELREILWVFSEILESVCVLPQLLLLRQTTVPTVIDSYYLVCLGSYRGFYILNWVVRAAARREERHFDPVSVIFGIIQTALYLDFAWVYYTRQRVKLRAGGIVDSDDLERGWLVGRLVGKHRDLDTEDSPELGRENVTVPGRKSKRWGARWGARGISVSADDDLHATGEDARPLTDPAAFEDELSDEEPEPEPSSQKMNLRGAKSPWVDDELER